MSTRRQYSGQNLVGHSVLICTGKFKQQQGVIKEYQNRKYTILLNNEENTQCKVIRKCFAVMENGVIHPNGSPLSNKTTSKKSRSKLIAQEKDPLIRGIRQEMDNLLGPEIIDGWFNAMDIEGLNTNAESNLLRLQDSMDSYAVFLADMIRNMLMRKKEEFQQTISLIEQLTESVEGSIDDDTSDESDQGSYHESSSDQE